MAAAILGPELTFRRPWRRRDPQQLPSTGPERHHRHHWDFSFAFLNNSLLFTLHIPFHFARRFALLVQSSTCEVRRPAFLKGGTGQMRAIVRSPYTLAKGEHDTQLLFSRFSSRKPPWSS